VASLWEIVVMVRVGKLRSTHTLRMFR
jgi:PIN domain nuclease of toxin-antitoxin system